MCPTMSSVRTENSCAPKGEAVCNSVNLQYTSHVETTGKNVFDDIHFNCENNGVSVLSVSVCVCLCLCLLCFGGVCVWCGVWRVACAVVVA